MKQFSKRWLVLLLLMGILLLCSHRVRQHVGHRQRDLDDVHLLLLDDLHLDVHHRLRRHLPAQRHRRRKKAMWIIFVIFIPLIGILIYMIARPKMTEQDKQMMEEAAGDVSTGPPVTPPPRRSPRLRRSRIAVPSPTRSSRNSSGRPWSSRRGLIRGRLDMCCLLALMGTLGPRIAFIIWWIADTSFFHRVFSTAFWPIIGVIFAPWTTLFYTIAWWGGSPQGDLYVLGLYRGRHRDTARHRYPRWRLVAEPQARAGDGDLTDRLTVGPMRGGRRHRRPPLFC